MMIDNWSDQPTVTNGFTTAASSYPAPMPLTPPIPPPPLAPPPPPVRRITRASTVALSVLVMIALALTGVFTVLFLSAAGDHDTVSAQLADRKEKLASMEERVTATDGERAQAEQRNDTLESSNAELSECVKAANDFLRVATTEAELDAALDRIDLECE